MLWKIIKINKIINKIVETRNIALTLDKAKEWYNSGNQALKEAALQAFTENELKEFDFRSIKTFEDAMAIVYCPNCYADILNTIINLEKFSKASAASLKLNIIRKALNKGHEMSFTKGNIWYPYTPVVLPNSLYRRANYEVEVVKVRIGCDIFTLLGGSHANTGANAGLGNFASDYGVAYSTAGVGFLGCATKGIAEHFGKYFAKEIFEAKYGDLIDYKWID